MTRYLLEANIFIQAKNLHYGFDFCPAFWDWLDVNYSLGIVASIDKVGGELIAGNDDLAEWAKGRESDFFLPIDEHVIPVLSETATWTQSQSYQSSAVSIFFQSADYYLVSYAKAHDWVVVTHEVPSDGAKK